jgi:hypothetical protein
MKNWKYFEDVDFSDEKTTRFNIDTRDFYCQCLTNEDVEKIIVIDSLDQETIKEHPINEYYHTEKEVKDLLFRFLKDSGGDGGWRILSLNSNDKHVVGWQLKYIRITRTDKGFLICNRDNM